MTIDSLVESEFDGLNIKELVDEDSMDFDAWTRLISDVEKRYPEVIEKISLVYEAFLSKYPLCYGYWRRYAVHMANLCSVEKAVGVYERAVASAPYSVAVWVDYCCFSISSFEDPIDICRLFRRGLSFVGKDYLCHSLWDKYIEYEFSQQHWSSLAHIYIQALKFPTKKLHEYYDSFKKLISICELDMGCEDKLRTILPLEAELEGVISPDENEICSVIIELLDPSTRSNALHKYLLIGEQFYRKACHLNAKINQFETNICRPYFHVKSLDDHQLENWHRYLDFVETQGDFDWAVKLYERCIIPCANYPEFWMRYVDYVESKGGREIANDALDRATKIFLKNVPAIHLFNANFKEQIGDAGGARAAFALSDPHYESCFVDNVMRQANMEKRLGNFVAASDIYKEAIKVAAEKKSNILSTLYVQFSRLQYMITKSVDSAQDILLDAVQNMPHCKLLLTELLNFVMIHEGAQYVNTLDPIIADAISQESDASERLSLKDRQDISTLYLECVNFCGTIHDVRRAWNRHVKLFPDLFRNSVCKKPARAGAVFNYEVGQQDAVKADCSSLRMGGHTSRQLIHSQDITEEMLPANTNSGQLEQATRGNILSTKINDSGLNAPESVPSAFENRSSDDGHGPNELVHHVINGGDRRDHEVLHPVVNDGIQEEKSNLNSIQEKREDGCKQELNALSLDCLSLNPRDEESPHFTQSLSKECAAPRVMSPSTGRMRENNSNNNKIPSKSSPVSTYPDRPLSPMPTSSLQSPVPGSYHSQQCRPSVSGDWDNFICSGKGPREEWDRGWSLSPRHSSHRHSEDRGHQERSLSPRRHRSHWHSRDGQRFDRSSSARRHVSRWKNENRRHHEKSRHHYQHPRHRDNSRNHRGGNNQNQDQIAPSHARGMQNVQQQGFASTFPGQPIAYPQTQMNQYQIQSNEQNAQAQSSQMCNQMWQYYYYHQQLMQQQPSYNQQLFQSQPPQQQQQMQPEAPQLQQVQPLLQLEKQPQNRQEMQSMQQQVQPQPLLPQQMQPQQLQHLQMQPLPQPQQQVQTPQLQLLQYQQQLQVYQHQQLSQPLEQHQFNQQLQSQPHLLSYHLQQLQQHVQLLQQQQQMQVQQQQQPSQQQIQNQQQDLQSQQQQPMQQQETHPYEQYQQQQYFLYLQQQQVLQQQQQLPSQPQLVPEAPEQDHQSSQQPKTQEEQEEMVLLQHEKIQPEREHRDLELEVKEERSP